MFPLPWPSPPVVRFGGSSFLPVAQWSSTRHRSAADLHDTVATVAQKYTARHRHGDDIFAQAGFAAPVRISITMARARANVHTLKILV
jgi:hypothetical protein